ncbi:RagB/SusD family nutrient uptake outer membrane protein [Galbibacter pacificus]|uniref:RagB/SusD family nutrient uptake outer membrane protein n=1 Tax=Galbibacter pacificus TaxID=2996052 RepID=A0ABT6FP10_9FLAO|nr:RagB/SusD family nutrient uptake outer membrane protein [Galbibacter pacificus]MDG3581521.1 RagB/SusD family nutrient uptake outer membrane protein [Galbibacter pacificus]MDG3584999.1 RagB/SusD family nutrient uptake outer membrane protein [Galbibacter pacificus]
MKLYYKIKTICLLVILLSTSGCIDKLDEPELNNNFTGNTDYTKTDNMILSLIGVYDTFYDTGWEVPLLIGVRGDDVNAAGDQAVYQDTDVYKYDANNWMYNSAWKAFYGDIAKANAAIEEINKYQDYADSDGVKLGEQYKAELKVMRAVDHYYLSEMWGNVFIVDSSNIAEEARVQELPTKEEVMQFISDQMDEAIPNLPKVRPNQRVDLPGAITAYTAYAVKALANQEIGNYQAVADATGEIIRSNLFKLYPDYYELFKTPGKLSDENLLELQFSDYGQGSGDRESHLYAPYGPANWTPSVTGASGGWGFYEPSLKYVLFMLDRGETDRLETSVLFTNEGIAQIQQHPGNETLPSFVANTTRDGDVINDNVRAMFSSGKHYLPSNQLIPGRTEYGSNKNYIMIRYAEVLLMYAEALTRGASGMGMTADDAVNMVRERVNMAALSNVTTEQVLDEKFAELALEWGKRYYDLIRVDDYDDLNYEGRTFSGDKELLPYPQEQVDELPLLSN